MLKFPYLLHARTWQAIRLVHRHRHDLLAFAVSVVIVLTAVIGLWVLDAIIKGA